MSLTRKSNAAWLLGRRNLSLPLLFLIALIVALICVLLRWKLSIDGQAGAREQQVSRLSRDAPTVQMPDSKPTYALSPAGLAQLSGQVALLNKDWAGLLNAFVPQSEIRLLGMDINPTTGSVRISGIAATSAVANNYAEALEHEVGALHQVRLLVIERRPDGIHFEVSAQWTD